MRILIALLSLSAVARAQPSPEPLVSVGPEDKQEARRLTEQGLQAWQKGEMERALQLFEDAYLVFPTPTLRFNTGLANAALGRDFAAIESFESFLRDEKSAPEIAFQHARDEIARLEKRVGTVEIECRPQQAALQLDGAPVISGKRMRVPPGSHTVTAQLAAHQTASAQFHIAAGETVRPLLVLAALSPPAKAPPPKRSVARSWWLWTVVGAAVAGGAIAAGVLLAPGPTFESGCPASSPGLGCVAVGERR
jgi:hypothetical protein